MARAHLMKTSRKEHICGRGGHVIPKGDPYYHASPGFRRRTPLIRCINHPFRPSELTTSAASEPLAAVEAFEDAAAAGFEDIESLESAWDELREAAEDYLRMREEALEAWEHGNSQLEELRDQAQEAYDELDGHTIEEYSGDDEPSEDDPDTWGDADTYEGAMDAWADAVQSHLDEQVDEALSVAGSVSF